MRLLNLQTLELTGLFNADVPQYAILSHRWGDDEVTLQDMQNGTASKMKGYVKSASFVQKLPDKGWNLDG